MIEGDRRMSPAEKAKRMMQLTQGVQQMALIGLRARRRDTSPCELWLPPGGAVDRPRHDAQAFGWDADEAR